ncbi:hypothetical protein, partial [Fusobacterium necrophorum]|uniref:hypothetical protein n=1 Tax=Fusobacterium necrophorum TaxID=859 RepID=UPI001B8BBA3F
PKLYESSRYKLYNRNEPFYLEKDKLYLLFPVLKTNEFDSVLFNAKSCELISSYSVKKIRLKFFDVGSDYGMYDVDYNKITFNQKTYVFELN